ncbi:hypothetical protein ARALYDRAFT_905865 [Arabidopsis lyrata subsp. lyrata]|uniref:ABC transporter family G domain-containing protein n=1 Tax=Arabidopsis lyrata subsp. lyrata TaxID=81972 RepID=D7LN33_ARALL|nr:hypothetical protein ARALYDRAFT_905865 [Arabidopsis lyrata subsp. lyrata]
MVQELEGNVVMSGKVLVNGKKKRLNFGAALTREEISDIAEATITDMGLEECSDRTIGNWHLRGISGGEKKRLSIALEILRNIASSGKTVISLIHQPSGEVFALFEDLLLLPGGETVYFGQAESSTMDSSFSLHQLHETSNTLDPLDDIPTAEIRTTLVRKFKCSVYAAASRAKSQEITLIEGLVTERKMGSRTNWWKQLRILTQRSLINMSRDLGYY